MRTCHPTALLTNPLADQRSRELWRQPAPPASHPLHGWLTDSSSLTARLQARCGTLSVTLLRQGLARAHADEALLLGVRPGRLVRLREVLLRADDVPVVYARSVVALRSLRGAWNLFSAIGGRPLGAALFADPLIDRGPLAARRLDARDARHRRACQLTGTATSERLWARRSAFVRKGEPLVVCEVFLPAIGSLQR